MEFNSGQFGDEFNWGVSAAAYQVEGAHDTDGKGPSIWDAFANTPGRVFGGHQANTTCDFYNLYAQDIALMSIMKIPNFRFSISWSRILPNGTGAINYKGIEFYDKVINFCNELGIEPWITLYHWDLPLALEKRGGWTNREVVNWFGNFVEVCIKAFGHKVKHWMVLNEPLVFTGAGYFLGVHAPGRKGLNNFLAAAHHAALCQAEGARIIKAIQPGCKVGTTISCSYIQPYRATGADHRAAIRVDALVNRLFIEPLVGLGYPVNDFKTLQRLEQYVKDGDEQRLAFDMDFVGVQNYTREIVSHSPFTPLIWAKIIEAKKRNVPHTTMNWEVYPECMYEMLKKYSAYNIKELVVTENGAAFNDKISDGIVHDVERTQYLQKHIQQVLRAKNEGINVTGYFVWSFTDNFEWAEGYVPTFGLVHVDFATQKRIIKTSGNWYGKFISGVPVNTLKQSSQFV